MNEDIRYGLCFKKRSSFETSFLMKFRTGQKKNSKRKSIFLDSNNSLIYSIMKKIKNRINEFIYKNILL